MRRPRPGGGSSPWGVPFFILAHRPKDAPPADAGLRSSTVWTRRSAERAALLAWSGERSRPKCGYYLFTGSTADHPAEWVEVSGGVALSAAALRVLVWLSFGVRLVGHRGVVWLNRGVFGSR